MIRGALCVAVLSLLGCGRSVPFIVYAHPPVEGFDAGPARDAGVRDAGVDAGHPDAGPQPGDGGCAPPVGPWCAFTSPPQMFTCMPDVSFVRLTVDALGRDRYELTIRQPVDHDDPSGPSFEQRVWLVHRSAELPVVLLATGYFIYDTDNEVSREFDVNEISVEHRYFGDSRPDGGDYRTLDIRQASLDLHHIRSAFAGVYRKPWVSTGASKGGMTMVYYRRFFPCDVAGTVAYVAPHSDRELDTRYNDFLADAGGPAYAECRNNLVAIQEQFLARRDVIEASLMSPPDLQMVGGLDVALERIAIDRNFLFWQYGSPDDPTAGCSVFATPLSDAELTTELVIGIAEYSDHSLSMFVPYYYQAATQLGDPAPYEKPLANLLRYPGKDTSRWLLHQQQVPPFDPQAMRDVQHWLTTEGRGIVFIYGELDPWSATQFDLGGSTDTLKAVAPGNNHMSQLKDLDPTDRLTAMAMIERWLGESQRPGSMLRQERFPARRFAHPVPAVGPRPR